MLYGAARAVREQHLKRRLAWSTVSNLSYMLFGLSLLTGRGMAAGLSHMVFHGLMKIILFFCAGAVLTCIYIFTVVFPAFFLRPEPAGETLPRDPGPCMKISLALLCLLLIAAGVFAGRVMDYLTVLAEGGIV